MIYIYKAKKDSIKRKKKLKMELKKKKNYLTLLLNLTERVNLETS